MKTLLKSKQLEVIQLRLVKHHDEESGKIYYLIGLYDVVLQKDKSIISISNKYSDDLDKIWDKVSNNLDNYMRKIIEKLYIDFKGMNI